MDATFEKAGCEQVDMVSNLLQLDGDTLLTPENVAVVAGVVQYTRHTEEDADLARDVWLYLVLEQEGFHGFAKEDWLELWRLAGEHAAKFYQ